MAIGCGQQRVPPQLLGLFSEQPDCGVRLVDQPPVPVGCFRRQPAQGNGKTRAGAPQEGRDHIPQAPGVGAAHVTVAIRLHEIGKRLQQPRDVGLGRRPDVQEPQQFGHGRGQVGGQRPVHAPSHPGQVADVVQQPGRRGSLNGVAPARRVHHGDGEFRFPQQTPGFLESAGAGTSCGCAPVDAEDPQAPEETGSGKTALLAQVEVELLLSGLLF